MGWKYTLTELAEAVGAAAPGVEATFDGVSIDSRTLHPGQVFFALSGENFDGNRFVADALAKGAVAAVAQAAGERCIVVDDPLKALQNFAAHHRRRHPIPVFALTGSCGKTSVKDLTAAVLGSRMHVVKTLGNFNNDIGCPLSLLRIDGDTEMAVIEMGANHMGEIAALCKIARPNESAITLVAPAHLEGFGSIENVAKAKGEIVEGLEAGGTFYVNTNDAWCVRLGEAFEGNKVYFGSRGDVVLEDCTFDADGEMRLRISPIGELRLPLHSRAHANNVLLAVAVGLRHGITEFEAPLREACLRTTRFKVFELGSLTVIDDTYNANPASVAAALETLASRPGNGGRIAALGDMLELGDAGPGLHAGLGELAGQLGIGSVYTYGPLSRHTVDAARAGGVRDARAFDEHKAIAEAIRAEATPGDTLLVKGSRGMKMETVIEELRKLI
ncbi:MAG: UDP-N-acetylmuramoyl-tripeptide--D-alanyl-D-alanine ligase [FCB group bacterium]|jgi:UDP-N-acetylmuramoyl-tripeptide--D-alanyl-D-alanine ligase|nr:UDP-N-acetylmuramoyl-tripeptide--D-alanyl-D-alanine ligase [FCB group bacterium]